MKNVKKNALKSFLFICLGLITTVAFANNIRQADCPSPPGKPRLLDVNKNGCVMDFTVPNDDGGAPLTAYWIYIRYEGKNRWHKQGEIEAKYTAFTATDVVEGSTVQFRVLAENKAGLSEPSDPSETVTFKGQ